MEVVKRLSSVEREQVLEKGGVLCRAICEILGKPKDHVAETARVLVQRAREQKDVELLEYDTPEVVAQGKLFTTFIEMEILFKTKGALMGFCFDFMPSSIEVLEPETIVMENDFFASWLNELQGRLHKVDMVAKERTILSEMQDTNFATLLKYNLLSHLRTGSLMPRDLQRKVGVDQQTLERFLAILLERGEVLREGDLLKLSLHVRFDYESEKQG